jgi:hypothetical protein
VANLNRIRAVVDTIEKMKGDKLHFDMSQWWLEVPSEEEAEEYERIGQPMECGTTMCFAGWAAFIENMPVRTIPNHIGDARSGYSIDSNGTRRSIEDWATEYFGLTAYEANRIFLPENDVDTIEELKQTIQEVLREKVW